MQVQEQVQLTLEGFFGVIMNVAAKSFHCTRTVLIILAGFPGDLLRTSTRLELCSSKSLPDGSRTVVPLALS